MRFLYETSGPDNLILRVVVAPLMRVYQATPAEKLLGLLGGVWAWVMAEAFIPLLFLLVLSGSADTVYGRRMAILLDQYDELKAEIGLQSKMMGVVMACLIWGFELWWGLMVQSGPFAGWHTHGFLSAAVALTLFVADLKSIQEKRERFGQRPLPVIGRVLDFIDRLASAMGAPDQDSELVKRRGDHKNDTAHRRRATDQEEGHAHQ